MITKKDLHKVEMELAYLFDEGTLTRDDIINKFTDLMGVKMTKIEDTPAYCPVCGTLYKNDADVEKCIKGHKKTKEEDNN